jgi:diguanylate cyclase (GGDEF)-like protein
MHLNARQRIAELWSTPEAVPMSVGQSLARAGGRLQAASLLVLVLLIFVQAAVLGRADRRADLAEQAALIAAEQPALLLRLGTAAGNPQPDDDFTASLATLRRNHAELTERPSVGAAPARATAALITAYAGTGYNLDARMRDLFALADRLRAKPPSADTAAPASKSTPPDAPPAAGPPSAPASQDTPTIAPTVGQTTAADPLATTSAPPVADPAALIADLRGDIDGPLQDRLQQAAQLHAGLARARLGALRWLQGGLTAALFVLLLLFAVLFRRLNSRVGRVIAMLESLAGRDPLTGVLSRNAFTARLRRMLADARPEHGVGLVLFDLDNFRALNSVEGDAAGDAVLRAVARRLRNAAGVRATVVRLTGDRFAVALPGFAGGHAALAIEAQRLAATLAEPMPYHDKLLRVGATAGTVLAPQDTADRGELLRMADIAVHEAKLELRGTIRPFRDPDTDGHARRETLLQTIAEPQFDGVTAWLQPVVRCSDRHVVGFEALARWEHPSLGRVPPAEFIPIAEASGHLPQLSVIVRKAAFHTLAACRTAGLLAPRLSLNLAPGEFARPATMTDLETALSGAGLTPAALEIEVTEDALLGDPENEALRALEALRMRGARLVLDNFGVGFASLVHLQRFTVDALKIDSSFIGGIGHDPRAEAILRAIIGLARALGITTIAKGVETDEQAAFLKANGCDEMQGYLVAAPMGPADIVDWLRTNHQRA